MSVANENNLTLFFMFDDYVKNYNAGSFQAL